MSTAIRFEGARRLVLCVAMGALLLGLSAGAQAFPAIDFTGGFNSETVPDRSFDLVSTTDQLNQFAFSVAVRPVNHLPLWLELGYQYGNNSAPLHLTGSADL